MGRPRKSNVHRDASGKSRGEYLGIHPETIAVRERELRNDWIILHQLCSYKRGVSEVPTSTATDAKAWIYPCLAGCFFSSEQGDRSSGHKSEAVRGGSIIGHRCAGAIQP